MVGLSGTSNASSARNLPVVYGQARQRRLRRVEGIRSDFASQLIAARDHLPVQRARRRAEDGMAATAYDRTGRLDERRMPMGYRLSVSV